MNIEYYRNFIAIVEAGSISAAAKRVAVAQPALSNQLKVLQKKFGAQLLQVKRGGHNIELTEAGSILYNKAKFICSVEDNALKEITDCAGGFAGTLKLSLSPSMSISFIKNYLSKFALLYPHINYELYEVPIDEQTQQLLDGKTELGIANAPLKQTQRFETIYSKKERLIALFHKDSPYLANDKPIILLDDLENIPLCLSRGCSFLFLNTCSDSQLVPRILSVNTTKLSTIAWAEKNVGVAVIPADRYEAFADCLIAKEIKDERLFVEKTLVAVKGRPLSMVAKTFVNFFLQEA